MKLDEFLNWLMGVHFEKPKLTLLLDQGFEDTHQTTLQGRYTIFKKQNMEALYDKERDEIVSFRQIPNKCY